MILYDFHHISKGCIVEVLYGDNRSFNVTKEFTVVSMRYDEPMPFSVSQAYATVDVYGVHTEYRVEELSLLSKPGYTRLGRGKWIADYMM